MSEGVSGLWLPDGATILFWVVSPRAASIALSYTVMGGLIFSHGLLIAQLLPRSTSPEVEARLRYSALFLSLCLCLGYRRVEAPLFESTFKVAGPGKFITHVVGDSGAAGSRPIGTRNALHHRARRSRDAYAVLFSCTLFGHDFSIQENAPDAHV